MQPIGFSRTRFAAIRTHYLRAMASCYVELQRRAEKHDHTRGIALARLERVWERRDIELRERTLWRLLYETADRVDEVLRLNVEDLDIPPSAPAPDQRAATSTGCLFGSGSARLLPRLIAGRRAGPGVPVEPAPEPGPRARRPRTSTR